MKSVIRHDGWNIRYGWPPALRPTRSRFYIEGLPAVPCYRSGFWAGGPVSERLPIVRRLTLRFVLLRYPGLPLARRLCPAQRHRCWAREGNRLQICGQTEIAQDASHRMRMARV